jgi:hypothetical protein
MLILLFVPWQCDVDRALWRSPITQPVAGLWSSMVTVLWKTYEPYKGNLFVERQITALRPHAYYVYVCCIKVTTHMNLTREMLSEDRPQTYTKICKKHLLCVIVVGTLTGYGLDDPEFDSQSREEFFCRLQFVQTDAGAESSLLFNKYRKRQNFHSPLSGVEVKNEWSCASSPPPPCAVIYVPRDSCTFWQLFI